MGEVWYTNYRNCCVNKLHEVIEGFETNVGYIVDCGFLCGTDSVLDNVIRRNPICSKKAYHKEP